MGGHPRVAMKLLLSLTACLALSISLVGCTGGDSSGVPVGDAQTKGGNVVQDPQLKEQLTGAANAGGNAPSEGPQVTQ